MCRVFVDKPKQLDPFKWMSDGRVDDARAQFKNLRVVSDEGGVGEMCMCVCVCVFKLRVVEWSGVEAPDVSGCVNDGRNKDSSSDS